ncbi:MAG: WD40 repeat domain-containing protein [Verrucomicrobiota bacterium]
MEETKTIPKEPFPWLIIGAWLAGSVLLVWGLAWLLEQRVHPWERVREVPGGYDEGDYSSVTRHDNSSRISFDPTGERVALARPDGRFEIWALDPLEKLGAFGKTIPEDERSEDHPALDGSRVYHIAETGDIFVEQNDEWQIYDAAGELKQDFGAVRDWSDHLAISPDGKRIAGQTSIEFGVFDTETKTNREFEPWDYVNGGNQRLQWFSDNRRLLVNDHLSLIVIDAIEMKKVFRHLELDLRLPSPMIPELGIGRTDDEETRRKWGADLIDSQLVANEAKIVSLYEHGDSFFKTNSSSAADRLRFYNADDGQLLVDHILDRPARSLFVSPDRTQVAVLFVEDLGEIRSHVAIYEADSGDLIKELDFKYCRSFPNHLTLDHQNRFFISYTEQTWMIDSAELVAAVKFHSWPVKIKEVAFHPSDELIITSTNAHNVHYWKKRRDLSRWGAWVLWEYWAAQFAALAGMIGLTIHLTRKTQARLAADGMKLPWTLWAVFLIGGLWLGGRISKMLVYPVVAEVWEFDFTGLNWGWQVFAFVASLFIFAHLVRLRNGARRFMMSVLILGLAYCAYLFVLMFQAPSLAVLGEITLTEISQRADGLMLDLPMSFVLISGLLLLAAPVFVLVVLWRKSVYNLFMKMSPMG